MNEFKNHQWTITDYGIEAITPKYPRYQIEASRLLEKRFDKRGDMYEWLLHMAEKSWVDIEAFLEIFLVAIEVHKEKYEGEVNPAMLKESIATARSLNKKHYG